MIELTLPDMTCGHCQRTVTETVKGVDPQARVEIELASHRVRIESTQPGPTFRAALDQAGYPAAAPA